MKKILLISTTDLSDNGISTFIMQSPKVLSVLGNKVTVVAKNRVDSKRKVELEENNIILLDEFNRSNLFQYFERLIKVIRQE